MIRRLLSRALTLAALVALVTLSGWLCYNLALPIELAPAFGGAYAVPPAATAAARVYFSPNGGCTGAIVAAVNAARSQILVQAYSFTSAPIAEALVTAHRRGVQVLVCLDRSQRTEHYSSATFLAHAGIPVWIDSRHAIAHSKVMVLDGQRVITGSFNFTKAADTSNVENLLILDSPQLAEAYAANWKEHQAHSELY